jgi:hypothetical protein
MNYICKNDECKNRLSDLEDADTWVTKALLLDVSVERERYDTYLPVEPEGQWRVSIRSYTEEDMLIVYADWPGVCAKLFIEEYLRLHSASTLQE